MALRFYATNDANLALSFRGSGAWMGQTVQDGNAELTVEARDADGETLRLVRILTKGGKVVKEQQIGSVEVSLTFTIPVTEKIYFVAEVIEEDGNFAISAPIWYEPTD